MEIKKNEERWEETRPILDQLQDCCKNYSLSFLVGKRMLWLICNSKLKPLRINRRRKKILKLGALIKHLCISKSHNDNNYDNDNYDRWTFAMESS